MTDEPEVNDDHDLPNEYDEETHVERTDVGVSITTELKRGTGTRDQDKHTVKAKGRTFAHARDQHRAGMDYVAEEVIDRSRNLQPEADDDD